MEGKEEVLQIKDEQEGLFRRLFRNKEMNDIQCLELMSHDVTPEFLESLKPSPKPKQKCKCHCPCREHQEEKVTITPRRVTFPEEERLKRVPTPNGGERIIRRRKRKSYD